MDSWIEYLVLGVVLALCLAYIVHKGRKQFSGDGCGSCGSCGDQKTDCNDQELPHAPRA